MLPFKYDFENTNKIDITQEGGGDIGLGDENYKLENWGALQILGYLLEGKIVLQKYINNDPGFTVNNLGASNLRIVNYYTQMSSSNCWKHIQINILK